MEISGSGPRTGRVAGADAESSLFFALLIGVPIGALRGAEQALLARRRAPDMMQTMPSFVYLIPAIPFFRAGRSRPASPQHRLRHAADHPPSPLGIMARQSWRRRRRCSQPLAEVPRCSVNRSATSPSAGINQTIMLALSMVVISAMIGAGGLGGEVWRAIQRLRGRRRPGPSIAIVVLAIILDRITPACRPAHAARQEQRVTNNASRSFQTGRIRNVHVHPFPAHRDRGRAHPRPRRRRRQAEKKDLTIAYVEWSDASWLRNHRQDCAGGRGYRVKIVPLSGAAMWQAVATGEADAMVAAAGCRRHTARRL